jgi:hypothetical protein
VALLLLVRPARAELPPLPPALQEKVNDAIDIGVITLKKAQKYDGSFAGANEGSRVGLAALPALALLECGEPKHDSVIRSAADFVRANVHDLDRTYELALSILLLDRLGDPKDKARIQTMGLRLISGQTATGGWGYRCPGPGQLSTRLQNNLLSVLQQMNPPRPSPLGGIGDKLGMGAAATGGAKAPAVAGGPNSPQGASGNPSPGSAYQQPGNPVTPVPVAPPAANPPANPPPPKDGKTPAPASRNDPGKKAVVTPDPLLKNLPVLQDPNAQQLVEPENQREAMYLGTTDNSNTQFAIMALAVASRWEVPIERTMALVLRRFKTSQDAGGGWNYGYKDGGAGEKDTMDCVGLLGLGVAIAITEQDPDAIKKHLANDPAVANGVLALSKHIGNATGQWVQHPQGNRYFLWSVERVGVLYDLGKIGDKEWYRWGAEVLVANQNPRGYWPKTEHYPGSSDLADTCMALLFLKKANFTKDIAEKIQSDDLAKNVEHKVGGTTGTPKAATPAPKPEVKPVETPQAPENTAVTPTPPVTPAAKAMSPPRAPAPAPAPPAAKAEEGNIKLWVWIVAGVAVLLALVSAGLVWNHARKKRLAAQSGADDDAEDETDDDEGLVPVEAVGANKKPAAKPPKSGIKAASPKPNGKSKEEAVVKKKKPAAPKPKPSEDDE